jgi:hypothetical protein
VIFGLSESWTKRRVQNPNVRDRLYREYIVNLIQVIELHCPGASMQSRDLDIRFLSVIDILKNSFLVHSSYHDTFTGLLLLLFFYPSRLPPGWIRFTFSRTLHGCASLCVALR